ncbi:MAG: hypothetical protein Q9201_006888 [Fulgogasparrea decipioides]
MWLEKCRTASFDLRFDLYDRQRDLCKKVEYRASSYSEEGMIEKALYLLEQLHRVQTMAVDTREKTIHGGLPNFVYEPSVELARLNEIRGNYFQAELVLEEILQTQKDTDWSDGFLDRRLQKQPIDSLAELYGLFTDRLVKMNYREMKAAAQATILVRAARIDIDQLSERLYSVGLIPPCKEFTLYVAAKYNACNLARLCLGQGVDVEGGNSRSESPLHTAIISGSKEMVELLLTYGANVEAKVLNAPDSYETPLHKAVRTGSIEIVLSLLSQHALIDPRDKNRIKTLMKGAFCGRLDMVPCLL